LRRRKIIVTFRPFIKDVALTFFTSIIVSLSSIYITRLFAQGMGPDEFGAYSLARRIAFLITTISSFDIGISIARYLGINQSKPGRGIEYFWIATCIVIIGTMTVISIGLLLSKQFSILIFKSYNYESLFHATLLLVAGLNAYFLIYAYYRGLGKMYVSNLWQFLLLSVGSVAIALLFRENISATEITLYMSCLYLIVTPFLLFIIVSNFDRIKAADSLLTKTKELLIYGGPRAAGGLTYQGFLSLGPILASYFCDLKDAGFIIIAQLLVVMFIETAMGSFATVALPRAAQLFAEKRQGYLEERINNLFSFIIQIGLFITIHLAIWSDVIIMGWVGKGYDPAIILTRVISIAIIPYMCFTMLKSIIDAVEVKAINTFNLLAALVAALLTTGGLATIGFGILGIAIGMAFGFLTLGYLTLKYLTKLYSLKLTGIYIFKVSLINIILFIPSYGLHHFEIFHRVDNILPLFFAFIFGCVLFLIYIVILRTLNVPWLNHIFNT
jgi:O-antigen/teichoic acid export membrane protein